MTLHFHPYDLRLRHTFTITHDSRDVQPSLIVELRQGEFSGYGEATSNKYYCITLESMKTALNSIREQIEQYSWGNPEELWASVYPFLKDNPFALCALDEAAHDLFAKQQRRKIYEVWGLNPEQNPLTNYTIGIDSIEKMVAKMQELPWPLYKIKLGTPDDLAIIRELRRHTDAVFRVDANCAWTAEQAIRYSHELKFLGVEFIEQPLPARDWEGMKTVFKNSALPVIADESCIVEEDVERCAGYFHGINIKLTKCGGLTPARKMITKAKSLGMKTMVGCMNESSIGISAIAHLLPLLDYVDMDGTLLISNDPASGVTFDYCRVLYAEENGTGARLLT